MANPSHFWERAFIFVPEFYDTVLERLSGRLQASLEYMVLSEAFAACSLREEPHINVLPVPPNTPEGHHLRWRMDPVYRLAPARIEEHRLANSPVDGSEYPMPWWILYSDLRPLDVAPLLANTDLLEALARAMQRSPELIAFREAQVLYTEAVVLAARPAKVRDDRLLWALAGRSKRGKIYPVEELPMRYEDYSICEHAFHIALKLVRNKDASAQKILTDAGKALLKHALRQADKRWGYLEAGRVAKRYSGTKEDEYHVTVGKRIERYREPIYRIANLRDVYVNFLEKEVTKIILEQ